jgi:hypothetical protein
MAIPSKQIGQPSSTKPALLWQISKQLEALTRVMYSNPTYVTPVIPPDPNCISFVADTTSGGTSFVMYVEVSSEVTYTVDWGDGSSDSNSFSSDSNIEHTYADENTAYTVQLCFSDASLVTLLEFWGND